jgi:multidrug efflux pump subunit AcrB
VADAINKQLERIRKELPADVRITVAKDNSTFIRDAVNDVLFDILYGGLLAIIVVYLFLANLRPTIISAIALPTSIIASFIIMYALNFTLNMMSLLALSLAVGLLIDDAIVVIENIYRHMQKGETPMEAARAATSEIGRHGDDLHDCCGVHSRRIRAGYCRTILLSVRHHGIRVGHGVAICCIHAHTDARIPISSRRR